MALMPSSRNTNPTVTPTAAALTHGSIMQRNPAAISKMPTARTQPQLRTPSACRSNALTNREMPENMKEKLDIYLCRKRAPKQ